MAFTHSMLNRKMKTDHRKLLRYPGNGAFVRASWIDIAGGLRMGQARLIDICERGIALELPERPQAHTYIRFQCDKMKLQGIGAVRHCQPRSFRFVVGVEFSPEVRWKPPKVEEAGQPEVLPIPGTVLEPIEWNWLFESPDHLTAAGND